MGNVDSRSVCFERGKLFGDVLGLAAGAAYGGYLLVVSRFRYKMPTSLVMGVTTLPCAPVFKNSVALTTLVRRSNQCRQKRSSAKKAPAAMSQNSPSHCAFEKAVSDGASRRANENNRNAGAASATR
jgi:hypothetical protein